MAKNTKMLRVKNDSISFFNKWPETTYVYVQGLYLPWHSGHKHGWLSASRSEDTSSCDLSWTETWLCRDYPEQKTWQWGVWNPHKPLGKCENELEQITREIFSLALCLPLSPTGLSPVCDEWDHLGPHREEKRCCWRKPWKWMSFCMFLENITETEVSELQISLITKVNFLKTFSFLPSIWCITITNQNTTFSESSKQPLLIAQFPISDREVHFTVSSVKELIK